MRVHSQPDTSEVHAICLISNEIMRLGGCFWGHATTGRVWHPCLSPAEDKLCGRADQYPGLDFSDFGAPMPETALVYSSLLRLLSRLASASRKA